MQSNHINYVEFYATDLTEIKKFYTEVFGWEFQDFGQDYTAFSGSGLDGGFAKTDNVSKGGPLVVLYHSKLEEAKANIEKSGGSIAKDIFSFPGGRRFHFIDPSGNELAIWSDR